MAGSHANYYKVSRGPMKGTTVYISKAQRGGASRTQVLDGLHGGASEWLALANTALPKGQAQKKAVTAHTSPGLDAPVVSFDKTATTGQVINGIPLATGNAHAYASTPDVDVGEPPFVGKPHKKQSAGIIMVEPDGRVWIVAPTNEFGGYKNTFPKGTLEKGLSTQQNALKEAFEEAGLNAKVTGFLGDFEGDTSVTRYYLGQRTGGHPADAHWETATTRLATPDELKGLLNKTRDKTILAALTKALAGETIPPSHPAPNPVSPGTAVQAPAPAHTAAPVAAQTGTGAFPSDPMSLPIVDKNPGGSTGAKIVQGPDGTRYVRKRGSPNGGEAHLREEIATDAAYRALGIHVPESSVTQTSDGLVKLSKFLEGSTPIGPYLTGKSPESSAVRKKLREGFAADALLGNWDVIGLHRDNVLVKDGIPYRIDNGGSLRYRAQGLSKATVGTPFTEYPLDLWGLRDGTNPKAKEAIAAFNKLTIYDVATQIHTVVGKRDAFLATMPADLRPLMVKRLAHMQFVADVATGLQAQGANSSKADSYLKKLMTQASTGSSLPSVQDAVAGYVEKWS